MAIFSGRIANRLFLCVLNTFVFSAMIALLHRLSPVFNFDDAVVYLVWLPLPAIIATWFLFGMKSILPLTIALLMVVNIWSPLDEKQALLLVTNVFISIGFASLVLYGIVGHHWKRKMMYRSEKRSLFFLFCVMISLSLKAMMFLSGNILHFPLEMIHYTLFISGIVTVIDILNVLCSVLVFTLPMYYVLRFVSKPRRNILKFCRGFSSKLTLNNSAFYFFWFAILLAALITLTEVQASTFVAGYIVPLVFTVIICGLPRISYQLVSICVAITYLCMVEASTHFLHGNEPRYSIATLQASFVFLSFCLVVISSVYNRHIAATRRWQRMALKSPVTNLPNLRALEREMTQQRKVTLCCIHISNLDLLGQHYGMVMREKIKLMISKTLRNQIGDEDVFYHLPGNNILITLHSELFIEQINGVYNTLKSKVHYWNQDPVYFECGISWVEFHSDSQDFNHILGQLSWLSEQARYATGRILSYDDSSKRVKENTTTLLKHYNVVNAALEKEEIVLFAQPIFDSEGHGYYEILSRVIGPEGMIMPDVFLPVVNRFNLFVEFDLLVIKSLLSVAFRYESQRFSVNLMPPTIAQENIAQDIIELFVAFGVPCEKVIFEITEEQTISHEKSSMKNISKLREHGFKIAIDDFGKGHANYERLKTVDADVIKIDGCFVSGVLNSEVDRLIVKSIAELAKLKGMSVVAEFVESAEQKDVLFDLGVTHFQGYYIGKPVLLESLQCQS